VKIEADAHGPEAPGVSDPASMLGTREGRRCIPAGLEGLSLSCSPPSSFPQERSWQGEFPSHDATESMELA